MFPQICECVPEANVRPEQCVKFVYKLNVMEPSITYEQMALLLETTLENKLDSKLEPLKNDIRSIRVDLNNVQIHVKSINERLYKLEERVARIDTRLDRMTHSLHQKPIAAGEAA